MQFLLSIIKLFMLITLMLFSASCNFDPPLYKFDKLIVSDGNINIDISSNKNFQFGLKVITSLNGTVICEKEMETNKLNENLSISLAELPIPILSQISNLLAKNDSVKFEVKLVNSKMDLLLNSYVFMNSPKSKFLSNFNINFENEEYSFDEKNLFDEEISGMIMDYFRFNKIFLNRIQGLNPRLKIKLQQAESQFTLKLPSDVKFKIWIEDANKVKYKLKEISSEQTDANYSKYDYTFICDSKVDGVLHILVKDIRTGLLYTLPIFQFDSKGPELSLSSLSSRFLDYGMIHKGNEDGYGYVSISHGDWEAGAVPLKVFVTGDVDKIYFNGESIPFRKDKSKYHTVYLNTHVGINSYEVKAVDLRGNISIDDYIIEAVSIRNNNPIIENNIENNIEFNN